MSKSLPFLALFLLLNLSYIFRGTEENGLSTRNAEVQLHIVQDTTAGIISIFGEKESKPILVQNAKANFRPYLHPIVAPDGKGVLTEYSPGHHNIRLAFTGVTRG